MKTRPTTEPNPRAITLRMRTVIAALAFTLLPLAAQAQTFPTCKTTVATFNGNLGGLAGADAKCAAEYPGYRMARNVKSVEWGGTSTSGVTGSVQAWFWSAGSTVYHYPCYVGAQTLEFYRVSSGGDGVVTQLYCQDTGGDCAGFTSANASHNGVADIYNANGSLIFGYTSVTCNTLKPIVCCNF